VKNILPPLIFFAVLALGLQFLVSSELVSAALVPAPTQILAAFGEFREDLRRAFLETLQASFLGYAMAATAGFVFAVALSFSGRLKRAILPFAIFFQTVPIIAIAPLLIIYLGFGLQTVVACAAIVAVFPVLANTLIGLESIDEGDLELFRVYGAGRWDTFLKLRLPRAYLPIYSGLKVAAGLSVIGAVAGEFVTGSGLGALIDSARTQQRIDLVFAALLLLSLIGLGLIGLLRLFNLVANANRPLNLSLKD
jgi:NitT/TauT family transport system permease protein